MQTDGVSPINNKSAELEISQIRPYLVINSSESFVNFTEKRHFQTIECNQTAEQLKELEKLDQSNNIQIIDDIGIEENKDGQQNSQGKNDNSGTF